MPSATRFPLVCIDYYWRELPQVLFLSRQTFCQTRHKHDKARLLSQRKNACCDKYLSRREYFCRDKRRVLSQQTRVCRNKSMLVATKVCLSRQNLGNTNIIFVSTNICLDKSFVETKIFCRDKDIFLRQLFCHNKRTIVATKEVFVATKHLSRHK